MTSRIVTNESTPTQRGLAQWHKLVETRTLGVKDDLASLLDDNVTFWSPILHPPQNGKELAVMYLSGAAQVLATNDFRYVREVVDKHSGHVVLEFKSTVDGREINGVDMIHFNENGKIDDFKVMLRPYSGTTMLKEKMLAFLQGQKSSL
eukprot:m.62576 g.62576  ORF g.62576 m.62576 type:complete len:149 (+) comp11519_c0_seq2:757-1203(+)